MRGTPMTIIDKRKRNLIEELKDKEYRDAYVSSSIDVGVAFQIRALREQQELNQTQLAEKAKMLQERISALENPSHSPTLSTLKKLAAAFDVGLIVGLFLSANW
jgi:ribosome-binding protein aMBF1 (putative translation factor)